MSTPERSTNPLALASLLIGAAGLPFAGFLGLGAVAALALGIASLTKHPGRAGAELAWAGILTSVLSLAAGAPLLATWGALDKQGALTGLFADEPPPTPVTPTARELQEPNAVAAQPPPPPPPPPTTQAQATPLPRIEPEPSERPGRARVEGGVPGGVVGGVVGGVSDAPAPPPSGPIRVGGAIREPMKLHNVNPVYPDIAKQARVQGIVILEATIGPDGTVVDVKILRGIPLLDQAAIDAVKQWRYSATLLNGVPVPVLMTVTVNFKLS